MMSASEGTTSGVAGGVVQTHTSSTSIPGAGNCQYTEATENVEAGTGKCMEAHELNTATPSPNAHAVAVAVAVAGAGAGAGAGAMNIPAKNNRPPPAHPTGDAVVRVLVLCFPALCLPACVCGARDLPRLQAPVARHVLHVLGRCAHVV